MPFDFLGDFSPIFDDVIGAVPLIGDAWNIGSTIGQIAFGGRDAPARGAGPGVVVPRISVSTPYAFEQLKVQGQTRDLLAQIAKQTRKPTQPPRVQAAIPSPSRLPGTYRDDTDDTQAPTVLNYGPALLPRVSGGFDQVGRQFPDSIPPDVQDAVRERLACMMFPDRPECARYVPADPGAPAPGAAAPRFRTGGRLEDSVPVAPDSDEGLDPIVPPLPGANSTERPTASGCGGGSAASGAQVDVRVTVNNRPPRRRRRKMSMMGNRKMNGRRAAPRRRTGAARRPEPAPGKATSKPTRTRRAATPAQMEARRRFAERARAGEFRRGKRSKD